jgi:hypothetical protein
MAEILQVTTILRCLFAPDSIPWAQMTIASNLKKLQARYKMPALGNFPVPDPSGTQTLQIVGMNGEFSVQSSLWPVQQLVVGENLVQVQIGAETATADAFLGDIKQFFSELETSRKIDMSEYTRTYQTAAVAKLNIPFDAMFSEKMLRYLRENVPAKIKQEDAAPTIQLAHLSWQVKYKSEAMDFFYLPKVLTIEPRQGSKISDNLYYTQSPTNSDTHKKLLDEFEAALSGKTFETATR